jgi:elongation factor Tu
MEIRELLSKYKFPGDDIPIVKGSALKAAVEGNKSCSLAKKAIVNLWKLVDSLYPNSSSCLLISHSLCQLKMYFSISGRGTVVTGRIESVEL